MADGGQMGCVRSKPMIVGAGRGTRVKPSGQSERKGKVKWKATAKVKTFDKITITDRHRLVTKEGA